MNLSSVQKKFKIKIILMAIIVILVISSISFYQYYKTLQQPVDTASNISTAVEIPRGSSTSKIASILKDNELIKNELYFKFISKYKKVDNSFQAGNYLLSKSMTTDDIINKIVSGDTIVNTVKFTIPEGFELHQIIERITNTEGLDLDKEKLVQIMENGDFDFRFLDNIPKGENRLEGFLFPDTYEVEKDINEEEVILLMLNRFNQIFKPEYYERRLEIDMSINEVITLASIIEREAKAKEERTIVSSVFHNRLDKKMLLQSCATVQYILGERKEVLTYADLEIVSPYNTYKNIGLPPKPIASPGEASIKAALYPAETDFLYFVAKDNGTHVFSKTYNEHLQAKNNN